MIKGPANMNRVSDIVFGQDGKAVFPTKYHGDVTLSKAKWDTICDQPERLYYRFNGEKIATCLINPDSVRCHKIEPNQYFYYKKFGSIMLNSGVEIQRIDGIYFAVIIDESTGKICTIYPVKEPKPGKAFKPKKS